VVRFLDDLIPTWHRPLLARPPSGKRLAPNARAGAAPGLLGLFAAAGPPCDAGPPWREHILSFNSGTPADSASLTFHTHGNPLAGAGYSERLGAVVRLAHRIRYRPTEMRVQTEIMVSQATATRLIRRPGAT